MVSSNDVKRKKRQKASRRQKFGKNLTSSVLHQLNSSYGKNNYYFRQDGVWQIWKFNWGINVSLTSFGLTSQSLGLTKYHILPISSSFLFFLIFEVWCIAYHLNIFIQQTANSRFAQAQIQFAACQRFAIMRTYGNVSV